MRLSVCTLRVLQEYEDDAVCDFLNEIDNVMLEFCREIPKLFWDGYLLKAEWPNGLALIQ